MAKKRPVSKRKQAQQRNQFYWLGAVGILLVLIAGAVLMNNGGNTTATSTSLPLFVSVEEAHALQSEGVFILDVREPYEWNENHLDGATLIPLGELPNRLNELPADQDIVVMCRSGNRSQEGRDILLDAGFSSVASMNGGINEWIAAGYDYITGP